MAIKTLSYRSKPFLISYEILNPVQAADIVFLHGWGSSKTLMKQAFDKTLSQFRHIYIDMPGFGGSNCDVPLTTDDYAAIIELFLNEIGAHKNIILGHSFGGKVATLLNPELLVLVASAGILVPKPFKIRFKIALFKLLKFTGLTSLRSLFVAPDVSGMSEEMYQTFKNVVNEDFTEQFRGFKGKALLCFGKKDTATPLWTGEVINTLIENSRLVVYEGNHYFLFHEGASIAREIEQSLNKRGE
uniref:Alpha/beta hydrolase fold protein n=1 Tax=uncultured bacterium pBF1 TaxID=1781162 RepID=A0A1C9U557_9BACT|nr:alpha/beta hydrolase fold protein [uncultured bacterium pBF1]